LVQSADASIAPDYCDLMTTTAMITKMMMIPISSIFTKLLVTHSGIKFKHNMHTSIRLRKFDKTDAPRITKHPLNHLI
jgi:hypothetical protein